MAPTSTPAHPVQISRYTGFRTLFASSVNRQEAFFQADLEVTSEREVEIVIHHGGTLGSPKTKLSFNNELWPQFRALMLEIIAEADRLMPQIDTLQHEGGE